MNFIVCANTDIGTTRINNQDSVLVKVMNTAQGRMVLAVLCDGMGGLQKGEAASAVVIRAFDQWALTELPILCDQELTDARIQRSWERIIYQLDELIKEYGKKETVTLGTTAVILLLTKQRFYILNVGDSRAYELTDKIKQLTVDQTYVNREIILGNMTEQQAKKDPRRNILLQCIGASETVHPAMFFGDTKRNAVYMLCSDGFYHEVTVDEIYEKLQPSVVTDRDRMQENIIKMTDISKKRGEKDNISVALIRTF